MKIVKNILQAFLARPVSAMALVLWWAGSIIYVWTGNAEVALFLIIVGTTLGIVDFVGEVRALHICFHDVMRSLASPVEIELPEEIKQEMKRVHDELVEGAKAPGPGQYL